MWFSELEQGLQKYAGYTPRPLAFSPPPSPLLRPRPLDAPPLPHLPPEILHIILRFAGGPAGIASNWRFEILRACALVARAWRGPSQAELFRHVKLNKLECAVRLLQTAEQANGKALVQCTVSLELGYELLNSRSSSGLRLDKVDTAQLTRSLLLICPNIRHLCIRGTNVALTDLSIASNLRSLHLIHVGLDDSKLVAGQPSPWRHPELVQLVLEDVRRLKPSDRTWQDHFDVAIPRLPVLDSESFPALEAYSFVERNDSFGFNPDPSAFAASLRVLHHRRPHFHETREAGEDDLVPSPFPSDALQQCHNLEEVSVRIRTLDDVKALATIASPIHTLRIDDSPFTFILAQAETELVASLRAFQKRHNGSLKTVIMSLVEDVMGESISPIGEQAVKDLMDLGLHVLEYDIESYLMCDLNLVLNWEECLRN